MQQDGGVKKIILHTKQEEEWRFMNRKLKEAGTPRIPKKKEEGEEDLTASNWGRRGGACLPGGGPPGHGGAAGLPGGRARRQSGLEGAQLLLLLLLLLGGCADHLHLHAERAPPLVLLRGLEVRHSVDHHWIGLFFGWEMRGRVAGKKEELESIP